MRFDDFRVMVEHLARDVPPEFRDGIVAIEVSPKTVPHPVRSDVYTLGECIPLEWSGSGGPGGSADLQSRIVLYHGSFTALARLGDFDWREEAWETLAHELRHHLEWRANTGALEAYDWAAEENFKRREGQPFDPHFYRSGEVVAPGVYKVDDDVFLEGRTGELVWHGSRYRVTLPAAQRALLFVTLAGLADPPPGDAVLVVPRRPRLFDLLRRRAPPLQLRLIAERLDA